MLGSNAGAAMPAAGVASGCEASAGPGQTRLNSEARCFHSSCKHRVVRLVLLPDLRGRQRQPGLHLPQGMQPTPSS